MRSQGTNLYFILAGDGFISREEMKTFIQEIWKSLGDPRKSLTAAVDVVMRHMDRDKNGYVSKNEFRLHDNKLNQA